MSKDFEIIADKISSQDKGIELLERLADVGGPGAVFGAPVESGEYTVITASEARVGLVYGYGGGGGTDSSDGDDAESGSSGFGGGGGGGGAAVARPVAIIEIGPNGARVEPIIDPTKIALAFFTTLLSIFTMGAKMRRALRR
ncbi:MAG: hypothetical protein JSW55_18995 [Chloroflexota bacterium]|nr:MAG: hypothetical protein JSW55_18995 [Chloroflexota bacterium]